MYKTLYQSKLNTCTPFKKLSQSKSNTVIRSFIMTNITTAITEIKTKVSLQEWQQRILDCRNSGMSVKAWCHANGISTGSYYFHLRKIRESVLEENQIIPLEPPKPVSSTGIRIESAGITVTLPETVSTEQLAAVLSALKSC